MSIALFILGCSITILGVYLMYIAITLMGIPKEEYTYHKEHDILSLSKTRLLLANAWRNF